MTLSVCIITYNEERIIKSTLKSVEDIADEIIIVDSFSTDKTKEVISEFKNVVFIEKKFEGYGKQKLFALNKCSCDWILFIDADEIPDKVCVKSIEEIKKEGSTIKVYKIEFENFMFYRRIKRGSWNNVKRIRLFERGSVTFSDDSVHESIITQDNIGLLKGKIQHFTYHDISQHVDKMNRYSELMAVKNFEQGKTKGLFATIASPFFSFIKNYFFKLGFLDGTLGLYAAFVNSFYTFMKYGKLRQKIKQAKP